MDVEMMKSSSSPAGEEHMDMMTMMMQIDQKLPDFCEPAFHNATAPSSSSSCSAVLQDIQFSNVNPTNIVTTPPPIYHNPHQSNSPTSINGPTLTVPFLGTPFQEPLTQPIQPNFAASCRFKYEPNPNFSTANSFLSSIDKKNSTAAIREMIFRIAAMQPIHIDPESIKPPKRRNVKISKDPQSVAARHRRERISERIRILQRLVPGGTKMDTASMLDEAIHYLKFLKKQVQTLEQAGANRPINNGFGFSGIAMPNVGYSSSLFKNCGQPAANMIGSSLQMLR